MTENSPDEIIEVIHVPGLPDVKLRTIKRPAASPPSLDAPAEITDADRIDWLERNGHSLMFYGKGKWDVHGGMVKPTAREAIDAAIAFFAEAEK